MKVEAIQIKNFRSIADCELNNCSGFNVLIGKNNSGKSNILAAVNAFFSVAREGAIISLSPTIGRGVDFHNNNPLRPAEVALTFLMSDEERKELVDNIVREFPQMTNPINSLNPNSRLRVRMSFYFQPHIYACVSGISLVSPNGTQEPSFDPSTVILEINEDTAIKFYEKYRQYQRAETRVSKLKETLLNIDIDDWTRMKRDSSEDASSLRRSPLFSRRLAVDQADVHMIETIMQESDSFDEFRSSLRGAIDTSARHVGTSDRHELDQASVETVSGPGMAIPSYVLKALRRFSEVKVLNVTDERRPIGKDEAQRLLNLKTRRGGEESLSRIQGAVSSLLGVRIDAFSGDQSSRSGPPAAEMDVDNFLVEVNGSGIKEALRLLLDIEFEDPSLLFVEEPEIHLHPGLETAMMRHLDEVSKHRQVFITTHSTNFLDIAAAQNIYLVSKAKSTTTQLLDRSEVEELVPAELGVRLSSLFIYDRLVFVESPWDEEIIRAWATTTGVNLDQSNVGFIHMHGSRYLSYFSANATLSFLSKRRVKMWFLIDRDEKDETCIEKIKDVLGNDVDTSVLERREIENYLIQPRVLTEVITDRLVQNATRDKLPPNTEEVKQWIEESAEELKGITILKRVANSLCQPLYPERSESFEELGEDSIEKRINDQIETWTTKLNDLTTRIHTETKKYTEDIETQWPNHKLDIVSGDLLLDKVFHRCGLRFRKERGDGVELAKRMSREEIGPEFERLIARITA